MSNLNNPNIKKMLFTDNDNCNYVCGYSPEPELFAETKTIISTEKVDYMICNEPEPEQPIIKGCDTEDLQKTISYLSIKSVEEGIGWYRRNFPQIPEELLPLMSRWNFGDLKNETKKSLKNNRKKKIKKDEKKFNFQQKPVIITFD